MSDACSLSSHDEAGCTEAAAIKEATGPLPLKILGLDIKFLCHECGTKLIIDVRWQGRELVCPFCGASAVVPPCPDWLRPSDAPRKAASAAGPVPPASRLSNAEIEFFTETP